MANVFRQTPDGCLDRPYLRTCAIYRLLKNHRIDKAEAIRLSKLPLSDGRKPPHNLEQTINLWLSGPLKRNI